MSHDEVDEAQTGKIPSEKRVTVIHHMQAYKPNNSPIKSPSKSIPSSQEAPLRSDGKNSE